MIIQNNKIDIVCHLVVIIDLAKLYENETKRINEVVRRNFKKFPERFSWLFTVSF